MVTENLENNNNVAAAEESSALNLQDFFKLCLSQWRWFVFSVAAALALAMLYLAMAAPKFSRTASLLIKEDDNTSSISSQLGSLSDLGVFSSTSNVTNEMVAIQSPSTILEAIRRADLNMDYSTRKFLRRVSLYGPNLPITAKVLDYPDNDNCSFAVDLNRKNNTVTLTKFRDSQGKVEGEVTGTLGDTLSTPVGQVVITPTQYYTSPKNEGTSRINVTRFGSPAAIDAWQHRMKVELADKDASVINITCTDVNTLRAEDFLRTLIAAYNEDWVRDKNQVATATSQFINDRLGVIEQELGNVDTDISSFKSSNLIPDLAAVSKMALEEGQQAAAQVLALNNELYMARYIRSFLADSRNSGQLLPANPGITNASIEKQLAEYNDRMLQRNSLVANSSTSNPLVVDLDHSLEASRASIISSIDNQINALNTQIRAFRGSEAESRSQIASNPNQAKYLLSVERQQKVKEALYLFLLQKREENELSQAFTAYNTRVLTPPMGKSGPVAPVSMNIMLIAFVVGLLFPAAVLFLRESFNTYVRTRSDLDHLTAPILGEIPMAGSTSHGKTRLTKLLRKFGIKRKAGTVDKAEIMVREGSRNVINEAFRVVRSNLEFILGNNSDNKVIMITSINPGSGKTFISANLAASFAVKGKKVCVIDLDLRKGTLSRYVGSPTNGVVDILNGSVSDWRKVARTPNGQSGVTILSMGSLPPNPSELLYSPHLKALLDELRKEFDLIFLDCAPMNLVADTSIIAPYADLTIFLVRSGVLDRRFLVNIERMYTEQKFNHMSVLLNGVPSTVAGYGYGYGYGSKK